MNKVSFSLLKSKQKYIEKNIYENYSIVGLQQNDYFDENIMPLFVHSLKKAKIIDSYFFLFSTIIMTITMDLKYIYY